MFGFLVWLLKSITFWVLTALTIWLINFYFNVRNKQKFWTRLGVKQVKPKFFFGHVDVYRTKPQAELVKELYNAFPEDRYHGIYQFLTPTLIIRDLDLFKNVTVKDFDHFVDRRNIVDENVDPFWSKSLFASEGERWRDLRGTLSPSFTSCKMRALFTLIEECTQQFVEFFKDDPAEVVELEMKDALRRYANDVIASTAFGLKCDSLRDKDNVFYTMGTQVTNFGGLKMLKFFMQDMCPTLNRVFRVRLIPEEVADYFSSIIEDTVKTRQEQNIVRPDMIHLMMEAQKGRQMQEREDSSLTEGFSATSPTDSLKHKNKRALTDEDIVSQAFIFFFAGFETASTFLTFVVYELAVNPEVQSRLREEIQTVEGDLTYEALLRLKYMDMVVSEILRKWPAVTVAERKVTKPYTIFPKKTGEKQLELEVGTICWLPIYAIHRDPKYYPEPDRMDPERFSDENRNGTTSFYFPFGKGPRNCLGSRFALLEAKSFIFHILRNFEIVPIEKTKIPVVLDTYQVNLTPKGGMWLGLRKLNGLV